MAASPAPSVRPSMNYHLLASLMSVQSDFAIFRRFLDSNARDLLRLQGEITHLESEVESLIASDRASGDLEKAEFEFCIGALKGPPHTSLEKGLQWEKQVELGHKLGIYSQSLSRRLYRQGRLDALANCFTLEQGTALLQYKQLCELPSANKSDIANLREVLDSNSGDRAFPRALENTIWSEENEADLTSLTGRYQKLDAFSKGIEKLLRFYHNKIGHRLRDPISLAEASVQIPITHYSDGKLAATVNAISTIISSLLPTMSIFALYFIPHPLARMAAIVAFSLLFSIALTVFAQARRVDCFAATTAFAAVQVVFVGTTVGSSKG